MSFEHGDTEYSFVTSQMSNLRINDSGTYQCLVQTSEGADYKSISLSVVGKNCESVTVVIFKILC